MRRCKEYRGLRWESKRWSISLDLQRWGIYLWWTKYQFGMGLTCLELTFYSPTKR